MKLLLFAALLASAQERAPQLCSISGRAIDAVTGEPLSKVQIRLQQQAVRDAKLGATTTDGEGRFAMSGIAPGTYLLKGTRSGYLEGVFGARRAGGAGTPLRIESGQDAAGLELKLHPFGVIAGTVRDRDGEPLTGVAVKLWRWKYEAESNTRALEQGPVILTDDLGQYRAASLVPGKYYVEASPMRASLADRSAGERRMEIDLRTFFPNAMTSATATQVEVTAGARITATDITLARSRVYRVRGVALSEPGIPAPVFVQLTVGRPGIDVWDSGYSAQVNRIGEFEIEGVPSGSYRMLARSMRPGPAGIFYDAWTRADVGGADVNGVRVVVGPGAEVTGTITAEGDVKASPGDWGLALEDGTGSGRTVVTPDGTFVSHLLEGQYWLRFGARGDPLLFVKSAMVGNQDVLKDGLTINGPVKLRMEVVVSKDGGSVEGSAVDGDSKELAGATVLLAPGDLVRVDLVRMATADQLGRFAFKGVPPGEYRVFAFDDVEPGAWLDREFWKGRQGEKATVKAKAVAVMRVKVVE